MMYLRSVITAWSPQAVASQHAVLEGLAGRLEASAIGVRTGVESMPGQGSWSGDGYSGALERCTSDTAHTLQRLDNIRDLGRQIEVAATTLDTARLRLLSVAALAEASGVLVTDVWVVVPVVPTDPSAAAKVTTWTVAIGEALTELAAADAAAAAMVTSATDELLASNGLKTFFPLVIGLGFAIELATQALVAAGVVTGAAIIGMLLERFGGMASAQDIMSKVPDIFRSDDGPGSWEAKDHHMSERASDYQHQITGADPGTEYVVDGVDFDGFKEGTLEDAKGPGYEQHLDADGNFKPYFTGDDALIAQARRQLAAAGDTPIEWSVAEERVADSLRATFGELGIPIDVTFVPPLK